jgi:hypothetical protein
MRTSTWLLLALAMTSAVDMHAADRTQLFIVGTLYRRHDTIAAYDLAALRRTIQAIKPDVLVLDITPDELRTRTVHASKIEYPGVIFPLLDEGRYPAFAAEPSEPMFTEIVQATIAAGKAFEQQHPAEQATMKQFTESLYAGLTAFWKSPADVNSAATDRLFAGKRALQARLMGPVDTDGWNRWNQHTTDVAMLAARRHRGKRVLVLVGIENRYWLNERMRGGSAIDLVDVEAWLRTHAPAPSQ